MEAYSLHKHNNQFTITWLPPTDSDNDILMLSTCHCDEMIWTNEHFNSEWSWCYNNIKIECTIICNNDQSNYNVIICNNTDSILPFNFSCHWISPEPRNSLSTSDSYLQPPSLSQCWQSLGCSYGCCCCSCCISLVAKQDGLLSLPSNHR